MFDSGVGGLSVLRAVRDEFPAEDLLYVADSAHAPYGDRPVAYVIDRATCLSSFLIEQGAKALVVACNTATAVAVESLRRRFDLPIVAIEPAVKPAASRSRSGVVGVLATTSTAESARMATLLERVGASGPRRVEFIVRPAPGLADRVEAGDLTSDDTRALVTKYIGPMVEKGADVIVLGCTHYPFLRPLVQEAAGSGVEVIDPAVPVAQELRRRLAAAGLLRPSAPNHQPLATNPPRETFYTSGDVDIVEPVVRKLWGTPVDITHLER